MHVCESGLMCVCQRGKKQREEEVYVFKAKAFVVDAVLWKLWVPSSVI